MWLYFNKNGQLITSLEHGSPARVGTTDFSIFAVFEGINDETALEAIEGATIKLRKPDLMSTEYPTLLMDMASSTFILKNGETGTSIFPFVPNQKYYGFLFDFGNFNTTQQEEILLDTDGLWEVTITLIKNNYNVQGVATFNVGGTGTPDPTNVSYDIVTNQLMQAIGRRALKSQVIIEIPDTSADISGYEEGQLFFCHEDKKLYIASLNEEAQEPFLELELFWEYQEKLVSTVNIKTINHKSILGSGNITIEGGGGSGESVYDIYGMFISAEDARNIFEGNYNIIEWTVTENIDGSGIYHGFQLDAGVYRLRYSRYNILSGAKTYQLALPLGQLVEIVFTHEVNEQEEDIYDLEFIDMSNSSVAATQATSTIIIDPLHNLNGRYLSRYNAELIDMGGYNAYKITYLGEPLSKIEAKRYMTAMTGSSFVPMYNQYRPQNSLFVMANGTFWKPQFDFSNGLLLYAIPNPYELATRKVSSWQMSPDNTHYPSEKLVYDNLVNVREVAEGKCNVLVSPQFDYTNVTYISDIVASQKFYVYNSATEEWEDKTAEFESGGRYYSYAIMNGSLENEQDKITISTTDFDNSLFLFVDVKSKKSPAIRDVSYFAFVDLGDFISFLNLGDLVLLEKLDVPDRWVSSRRIGGVVPPSTVISPEVVFSKLETSKVDLSNCAKLSGNNTFTGDNTFTKDIEAPALVHNSGALWLGAASGVQVGSHLFPGAVGSLDLGHNYYKWRDLYLSGKSFYYNSNTAKYAYMTLDQWGNLNVGLNVGSGEYNFFAFSNTEFFPTSSTSKSLGTSSYTWKDIYLSEGINIISNNKTTKIWENSSGTFLISYEGSDLMFFYDASKITFNCNVVPNGGGKDLGDQYNIWRDLYLSGNITDGTNSYSVAESMAQFNPTDTGSTTIKWSQMLTFSVSSTTGFTFETAKTGCMPEYKAIITNSHTTDTVTLSFSGVQHILCNDDNIITTSNTIALPAGVTIEISCVNNNLIAVNFGA